MASYITCNMKDPGDAFVGDTISRVGHDVPPLPGSKPMQSMVFAGIFPLESNDFAKMEESIGRVSVAGSVTSPSISSDPTPFSLP